jgi:alkenylglycerophosphocholine hydrolase
VSSLGLPLILYAVAVAVSLAGLLARQQLVLGVGKPVATVLLFAVIGGVPTDLHGYLIFDAIALSLAADITLLAEGHEALVVGLGLFLVVHLCYGLAFLGQGPGGWLTLPGLVIFGAGSLWLVRYQWRQVDPGLRVPIAVHALTLTFMLAAVFSLLAGRISLTLAALAAVGATLFYYSQALLPWARRRRAPSWAQPATLALYWAGQLCLALVARWTMGDKFVP